MVGFAEAVADTVKGGACTAFGGLVGMANLSLGLARNPTNPGQAARDAWKRANDVRRYLCNNPAPIPEPVDFSGGQCSSIAYRAVAQGTYQFETRTLEAFLTGPVSPSYRTVSSGGTFNGEPAFSRQVKTGAASGWEPIGFSNMSESDANTWKVVSLTRLDGQPDDCGDPDFRVPDGGPVEVPVTVTYEDNSTTVNLAAIAVFGIAYADVDLSINVPVTVRFENNFNIRGTLQIAPEFNFKPSFNVNGPGNNDDNDEPNPDPNLDDDDPNEPEDERPIIGVFVYSRRVGDVRATQLDMDGPPDLLVPRIATVQFRIQAAGLRGWALDQPVKTVAAWIPVQESWGAIDARATWENNWEGEVYAVRAPRAQDLSTPT